MSFLTSSRSMISHQVHRMWKQGFLSNESTKIGRGIPRYNRFPGGARENLYLIYANTLRELVEWEPMLRLSATGA